MPRKSRLDLKTPSRRKETAFSETKVPTSDFWQTKTVEELAVEQGVKPIENPDELLGDFWPEDESIDDFLIWLRKVRRQQKRDRKSTRLNSSHQIISYAVS